MPGEFSRIVASPHEPGVYYVDRDTWQVGTRYELRKVLGTGSFSAVCLAWDRLEGEKVALKRVGDVFASPDYAKRVLREVCIMRRLEHPNIIRLKDVFLKPSPTGKYVFRGGRLVPTSYDCYMAMECCEQGDLFNMRGQLPEHEVRSLLWQLLSALRYLHGLNVWHRDIKTGNVLLSLAEGRRVLKVADFGSARSAKEGGEALGMGPPQDAGDAGDAGMSPVPEPESLRQSSDGMELEGGTDAYVAAARRDPIWRGGGGDCGAPRPGCGARAQRAGLVAVPAPDGGYQPPLTSMVCTPCYRAPEVVMSRGGYSSAIDMWSAGCVFGELLQRVAFLGKASTPHLQVAPVFALTGKPLTPHAGQRYGVGERGGSASAYAELSALFAVIGTPAWACIEAVPSEAWRQYLFHIPGRAPTLHRRFGQAGEVAVDLLVRLLQFDPGRRASAEEAMAHEYFAMMHMEAQMEAAELTSHVEAAARTSGRPGGPGGAGGLKPNTAHQPTSSGGADDEAAVKLSAAAAAATAAPPPLPTWPPGRVTPQRGSGSGGRGTPAVMEVEEEADKAPPATAPAPPLSPLALVSATAVFPRRRLSSGGSLGGGCGTLLTKRKQLEDASDGEQAAGLRPGPSSQCRQHQADGGSSFRDKAPPLSFWQLDEPALALAALEAELASLVPPDADAFGATSCAPNGARAATAMPTPEALAFVEECKERLRQMLERECEEHAATAAARRGAEHDLRGGAASSAGGSATGGSGSGGAMGGMGSFRRNNSDGLLVLYDGQLLGGPAGAAALHGHLRPDPGQQLDPSMIGYERIPYHADAAAARLEPEKHLWAGRHGEWTESSLAAQPREHSAGTWGVSLMPPGMDEGTAAGRAYIDVMRSQHAR